MAVAESFVRSRLGPYEARIRSVIDGACSDYLSIDVRHKFLFSRTRANIVFDLIAGRIIAEFDGDKAIRIIQKDETVKVLLEDALLRRSKKSAEDGLKHEPLRADTPESLRATKYRVLELDVPSPQMNTFIGDLESVEGIRLAPVGRGVELPDPVPGKADDRQRSRVRHRRRRRRSLRTLVTPQAGDRKSVV